MTKIDGGLSDEFRKHLPGIFFQRVETGGTGRGIPDSCYCGRSELADLSLVPRNRVNGYRQDGTVGWVEFKATDGWSIATVVRPEQWGWIDRWARSGGRAWLAFRRAAAAGPRRGEAVDELWTCPGRSALLLRARGTLRGLQGVEADSLGVRYWTGGPSRWGWDAVRGLLLD